LELLISLRVTSGASQAVAALYQRAQVGGESDPALTVAFELADLGSMQRRCAGPGIDLRAQAHHAEIRQGDPFTQTDHGMGVESLQWERPKNLPAF